VDNINRALSSSGRSSTVADYVPCLIAGIVPSLTGS